MTADDQCREVSINAESTEPQRIRQKQGSLEQACVVAHIADEYKGRDTLVLDLTEITPIVDYFVLTTGTSRRQMHAVAEEVDRVLGIQGSRRIGLEGYESSNWILQDYGDIVLHVFTPEARALYDLEHLWADARRIDWQEEARLHTAP